jgi:hypothetical protein
VILEPRRTEHRAPNSFLIQGDQEDDDSQTTDSSALSVVDGSLLVAACGLIDLARLSICRR